MLLAIILLIFTCAFLLAYLILPRVFQVVKVVANKREKKLSDKMDAMYLQSKGKRVMLVYALAPIIFGGLGFFLFAGQLRLFAVIGGIVLGFVGPGIYFKFLVGRRKKMFYNQLIDSLMMMNSSLKGGLSLLQAMEVVADEMPIPISQEFAILIGENKMGVSLETSFDRLYKRMESAALQQFISAVLLARETGGNLPIIFNRIIGTIRENKKIQQNIETLTLQGKLQGFVMSLLPIGFAAFIYTSTPEHFDIMLESTLGRNLLGLAAILEVVGAIMIIKISQIKEF
ncbi:MAG: type II secretion system F family protein [Candidatus Aceula meridiana]|nr:type II secretion system F family protein [Candidatus Aceula meridiana]